MKDIAALFELLNDWRRAEEAAFPISEVLAGMYFSNGSGFRLGKRLSVLSGLGGLGVGVGRGAGWSGVSLFT